MTALDADLDRFVARLRQRLVAGAETYGDTSFTRPAAELVDEVQQELEDVCGWSLLLWIRLERVRRSATRLAENGEEHG
jgi:hypothetical protein